MKGSRSAAARLVARLLPGPALLIPAAVFLLVCLCWRAGLLQLAEFHLYDWLLTRRPAPAASEPRVVIVAITEADIQRLQTYPLPDTTLARLLETLAVQGPAAIGVDLFRDLPVPQDDPAAAAALRDAFFRHPNIVAIQRLARDREAAVGPPAFLGDRPEQIGFNDFAADDEIDGAARRALLLMDDGASISYSVSLLAALLHLQQHGIALEQDPADPQRMRLGRAELRPFEANDGAYVGADARGYQMLLDFKGPRAFPAHTLHDVLDGRLPAGSLRGKVVLIGAVASSLKDFVSTPLAARDSGVQLHARVVDQLLRAALDGAPPRRFFAEWQEALWILAWCGIGAALGLRVRSPFWSAGAALACAAALACIVVAAFEAGWWLLAIAPGAGLAGSAALGLAFAAQRETRDRRLLMEMFGRHVSPEIAAEVWEQREEFLRGGQLRPRRLTATVMFTDLRGYSGTSEDMDAEDLMRWLNEYVAAMSAVVFEHGGVVNKFLGDSVMALFGVPLPRTSREDIRGDAVAAVRCALSMGRRLRALNARWSEEGLPTTAMRVGIATGELVAGSLGGAERLEYTVIGDTVNTASRLESAGKETIEAETLEDEPCRILVGDSTCALLGGGFETRPIGGMVLRGKKERVEVHLVLGEKIAQEVAA